MSRQYNNYPPCFPIRVFYTGTDTLQEGYALCYDWDAASKTVNSVTTLEDRFITVEKPSFNNLAHFAGVVAPGSAGKQGPCHIEIIAPAYVQPNVNIWCDEDVAAADLLGITPGSYAFTKGAIYDGIFRARSLEAQDRSSTAGPVMVQFGPIEVSAEERMAAVNEIIGLGDVGSAVATTAAGQWLYTEITAGSVAPTSDGALLLTGGSATDADGVQIQRGGLGVILAAGRKLYMSLEVMPANVANADLFFGLAELDTTLIASSAITSANHLGWTKFTSDGVMLHNGEKASAGATTAAGTLVDATWSKFAMLVNGVTSSAQYINNVAVAGLATANIPIVGITPSFVCQVNATATAPTLSVRRFALRQQLQ